MMLKLRDIKEDGFMGPNHLLDAGDYSSFSSFGISVNGSVI